MLRKKLRSAAQGSKMAQLLVDNLFVSFTLLLIPFVFGIINYTELTQIEAGASVRIWWLTAFLYRFLGYWPAILFWPALGLGLIGKIAQVIYDQKKASREEQASD